MTQIASRSSKNGFSKNGRGVGGSSYQNNDVLDTMGPEALLWCGSLAVVALLSRFQMHGPSSSALFHGVFYLMGLVSYRATYYYGSLLSSSEDDRNKKKKTSKPLQAPPVSSLVWRLPPPTPTQPSFQDDSLQHSTNNNQDVKGIFMSLLLIPLVCLGMGCAAVQGDSTTSSSSMEDDDNTNEKWYWYALGTILLNWACWESTVHNSQRRQTDLGFVVRMTILAAMIIMAWICHQQPMVAVLVLLGETLYSSLQKQWLPASFHQVFTQGEWMVVTNLVALALTLYLERMWEVCFVATTTADAYKPTYATISMAGLVSAVLTCPIMSMIKTLVTQSLSTSGIIEKQQLQKKSSSSSWTIQQQRDVLNLLVQIPLWIGIPLLGVELLEFILPAQFSQHNSTNVLSSPLVDVLPFLPAKWMMIPQALHWLVDFLLETEELPVVNRASSSSTKWLLPHIPRYGWILYWIIVLAISIPLSPKPADDKDKRFHPLPQKHRIVLARKWFHGIAVLLFTPVTLAAPQLLSLSYAIALAILILVESARMDLPMLQQFHERYLDPSKDDANKLVISHMALILGCAIPLWISQLASFGNHSDKGESIVVVLLLPLWGVISLGIGDAMGAIVGVLYGNTKWSPSNPRTLEGSLAMWLSMMATYLLLECYYRGGVATIFLTRPCWPSLVATSFVVMLEAHTFQIDNLVLPLAGSGLLLVLDQ